MISADALPMTTPAMRMERPECEAAADRNDVGVALDQRDAIDRYAEPLADALRETGLVALAARQGADRDVDAAFRPHRDLRIFARRAAGRLDVVGKPDAAQPAAALRLAPARRKSLQSASASARSIARR